MRWLRSECEAAVREMVANGDRAFSKRKVA
jgi:hypothetical protein